MSMSAREVVERVKDNRDVPYDDLRSCVAALDRILILAESEADAARVLFQYIGLPDNPLYVRPDRAAYDEARRARDAAKAMEDEE